MLAGDLRVGESVHLLDSSYGVVTRGHVLTLLGMCHRPPHPRPVLRPCFGFRLACCISLVVMLVAKTVIA